jgi:hypothetical protein
MAFSMDDILRAKGLPVNPGYNPGVTMTGSGENAFQRVNVASADHKPTQAFSNENALEAYQRAQAQNQLWQSLGYQTNVHGAGTASDAALGGLFDPVTGMNFGSNPNGGFYGYDAAALRQDEGKDNFALNGQPYFNYGADGSFQGQDIWTGLKKDSAMDQLLPAMMMLAPFALTAMGVGGAAGAGGAAGGAGAGGAGAGIGAAAGDAGLMYAGADAAAAGMLGSAPATLGGSVAAGGAAAGGLGGLLKSLGSGASSLFGGGGAGGAGGAGGLGSLFGGGGSGLLGLGATALGALGGGQGNNASNSSTRAMDPRMDALFYGDLAPRAQNLLGSQLPQAIAAGGQMMGKGSDLLGQTAPTTATNPYLASIADDMQRRTMEMLGQNNTAIQGNAVGMGGLGGSRQGVAQGIAAGQATDNLQGNLAALYGSAYNQDQNRLRQDWTIGSGLMNQGLQTPWQPIQNTSNTYAPFTGYGTTTNSQESGGGWQGALGGALTGASLGRQMGWW